MSKFSLWFPSCVQSVNSWSRMFIMSCAHSDDVRALAFACERCCRQSVESLRLRARVVELIRWLSRWRDNRRRCDWCRRFLQTETTEFRRLIYGVWTMNWLFSDTDKLLKPDEPMTVQPTGVRTANGELWLFEIIESKGHSARGQSNPISKPTSTFENE